MSFLSDIKQFSKSKLKETETHIMTPDGRKLIEKKDDSGVRTVEKAEGSGLGFVGDYKPDLQIGYIMPGLLMGSQDVAADLNLLRENKVTHILNLAYMCENQYLDLFTYKTMDILDLPTENITEHFKEAFSFIDNALKVEDHNVFVHCNAGVSRSATIVIAYVMKKKQWEFQQAYDFVKSERPSVKPNEGFTAQLKRYDYRM